MNEVTKTSPADREKIMKAAEALAKLPPAKRAQVIQQDRDRRSALAANLAPIDPESDRTG
jgi:hypothetical protein